MADETALVPVEEKTVDFYGDQVTAALVEAGETQEVYVPVRPLCDYLGLAWAGQFERLKRDPVMSEALRSVRVTRTEAGGKRDVVSLPLKFLPGWLFGINAARVKPELREKIIRYQRECFEVLWQAFQAEALAASNTGLFNTTPAAPPEPSAALVQIREMGLAIVRMAEQQMELEQQVNQAHQRLDQAGQFFIRLERRVEALEHTVQPGARISEAQASVVSSTVKALAEFLSSKQPGKNHYQGIFSELYRRFRVTDYHNIRQADYEQVLNLLNDWQQAGGGKGIPVQGIMALDEPNQG